MGDVSAEEQAQIDQCIKLSREAWLAEAAAARASLPVSPVDQQAQSQAEDIYDLWDSSDEEERPAAAAAAAPAARVKPEGGAKRKAAAEAACDADDDDDVCVIVEEPAAKRPAAGFPAPRRMVESKRSGLPPGALRPAPRRSGFLRPHGRGTAPSDQQKAPTRRATRSAAATPPPL